MSHDGAVGFAVRGLFPGGDVEGVVCGCYSGFVGVVGEFGGPGEGGEGGDPFCAPVVGAG